MGVRNPLSLSTLVAGVGDDHILVEPVHDNIIAARRVGKRAPGLTAITLHTTQFTPDDLMALTTGSPIRKIGLLIWLPMDAVERVKKENG